MCLLQSEAAVGTEKETTGGSELLSRGEVSRTFSFIKSNLRNDAPVVVVWTRPCVEQVTSEGIPSQSEPCRFAPSPSWLLQLPCPTPTPWLVLCEDLK